MRRFLLGLVLLVCAVPRFAHAQGPTPVVVTDLNGKVLVVTGTASATQVGSPLPVVITDSNGKAITLGGLASPGPIGGTTPNVVNATNVIPIGGDPWIDVTGKGALGNGIIDLAGDASISSTVNTTTLTCTSCAFTSTAVDGGKIIIVPGAGAVSEPLITTISAVTNSTTAILANAASTTVTNVSGTFYGSNDATAINAALSVLPAGGGTVWFPCGNYVAGATLTIPTNRQVRLTSTGGCAKILLAYASGASNLITADGTQTGTNTNLNANVAIGAVSLTVISTTGFNPGDWVQLADNGDASGACSGSTSNNSCNLELVQIDAISSSTVMTLRTSTTAAYTTANSGIVKRLAPVYLTVDNLTLSGLDTSGVLLDILYGVNSRIDNVAFEDLGTSVHTDTAIGLNFRRSIYGVATRLRGGNYSDNSTWPGFSGYPVNVNEASSFITISNGSFYKIGQLPITNFSRHVIITGNHFSGCADSCINTHNAGIHHVTIANNIFQGAPSSATTVQGIPIIVSDVDGEVAITGNEISNYALPGISVSASVLGNTFDVAVTGNVIRNPLFNLSASPGACILILRIRGFTASGNTCQDVAANQQGLYIELSDRGTASGNTIRQTLSVVGEICFRVVDSTNLSIIGNAIVGCSAGDGLRIDSSGVGSTTAISVSGNSSDSYVFSANITAMERYGNVGDTTNAFTHVVSAPTLTSSVATGTAPLTVTSTTPVANLALSAASQLPPLAIAAPAAVTIGSGSSISATSLCSTTTCPAGDYDVSAFIEITTACTTTGSYIVWLGWTDDATAKTGSSTTTFIPINGLGVTQSTGALALASTSNYGQGHHVIHSTGAATGGLGSINFGTTATACGTGGPMVGKLFLDVTRRR